MSANRCWWRGFVGRYARRGLVVRPFKPQNMSNNAAVTADGGEIGRAQALQARACRVAASVDMNPVLLKPQSEVGAQVVVQGRVLGNYDARAYLELRPKLLPYVLESYARISEKTDLVLVEGAGSPAEVNLREGDIANMGFAVAAGVPVVLVGDIERGGVIAALVGTAMLLEARERERLKGYIVNKFRGDPSLFEAAHGVIAARTGMRSYGVVPWFEAARRLPAEDVLGLEERALPGAAGAIRIAVPRLPRLANFDDLDPLAAEPDVFLDIVPPGKAAAGGLRPRDPGGGEGDAFRPCGVAGGGVGRRSGGACPARGGGARDLRGLADAGAEDRRSGGRRGPAGRGGRAWAARSRDHARRRQAAGGGRGRRGAKWRKNPGL